MSNNIDKIDELLANANEKLLDAISTVKKLTPVLTELTNRFNSVKIEIEQLSDKQEELPYEGAETNNQPTRQESWQHVREAISYPKILKAFNTMLGRSWKRYLFSVPNDPNNEYFMITLKRMFMLSATRMYESMVEDIAELSPYLSLEEYEHTMYYVFNIQKLLEELEEYKI